jgi:hypothetical protein
LTTNFLDHKSIVFFVAGPIILEKLLIDLFGNAPNDEIINRKNSITNFFFLKFFSFNCFLMVLTKGAYLFVLNSITFFSVLLCSSSLSPFPNGTDISIINNLHVSKMSPSFVMFAQN